MMAEKMNPKAFAIALTLLAFVLYLLGFAGRGMLGSPYMMGMMYSGYLATGAVSWSLSLLGLIGTLVAAFVLGYIFALLYNWADKNYK